MIKRINKTEAFKARMKQEGKVTYLNQPQHITAIVAMNKQLEATRREYQVKDRNSQLTAASVILTD